MKSRYVCGMRILCSLVMLVITTSTVSAQKCAYRTNGNDDFTNERKVITASPIGLSGSKKDMIWFRRIDGTYSLHLHMRTTGTRKIEPGAPIMLKFDDGRIIELNAFHDQVSNFELVADPKPRWIKPAYTITREQLGTIAASPLRRVRVYYTDGYRDYSPEVVKPRRSRKVMQAAKCLLAVD